MESLEELKRIATHVKAHKTVYGHYDFEDAFTPDTCLRLIEAVEEAKFIIEAWQANDDHRALEHIKKFEKLIGGPE